MEIFKKIAFGAYYISIKQNDGKVVAYLASKIAILAATIIWFLVFTFFLMLLGISLNLPPFRFIVIIFTILTIIIPIKRKDMEAILMVNNKEYISQSVKLFWFSIFGPIVILLFILVLLKYVKIL